MPKSVKETVVEGQTTLVSEQLGVMCKSQLLAVPFNSALGIFVACLARTDIDNRVLIWWLGTLLVVNGARMAVVSLHRRRLSDATLTKRVFFPHNLLALASGLAWAVVPAEMFVLWEPKSTYVVYIIFGLTAGAAVQAWSYAPYVIVFVCPIMTSLVIKLVLVGGTEASYFLALTAILYTVMICLSARRSEATFVNTVMLRLKATSLAESLNREHTAAKASAERLYRLANHDSLTGLANRSAFANRLAECLDQSRAGSAQFGLLLLDLDHFKSVNDTLGHSAGDEILRETARRLTAVLDADHLVSRLGGDEFAILYHGPAAHAERLAQRILDAVSGTFDLGDHPVGMGLSVGLAMFPADGSTTESLLANADLALYAAKDAGRQRWRRFDEALLAQATMMRGIERDLPGALAEHALQLYYQPQVALSDGRVTGVEGLLRWKHPLHGWISPPLIVAAARRIRQSEALTDYVIGEACRQIRRLGETGFSDVMVAINVSPSELDDYDLPDLVRRSIATHRIDPGRLEVEITEEAFAGSQNALAALSALSAMGVRVAIDDFGTGCSALAYLRSMRVDRIKIDRSFVTGLSERAGDRILVQAILGIGRSFGMEVLAEGVETIEDVRVLKALGCGQVQGYHFSHPLRESDLVAWLDARSDARRSIEPLCSVLLRRKAAAA